LAAFAGAAGKSSETQMRETNPKLIDDTITVFQQRSCRRLSREDAREITENITGFFTVLAEWSRQEKSDGSDENASGGADG
jgi:hypothetical protein